MRVIRSATLACPISVQKDSPTGRASREPVEKETKEPSISQNEAEKEYLSKSLTDKEEQIKSLEEMVSNKDNSFLEVHNLNMKLLEELKKTSNMVDDLYMKLTREKSERERDKGSFVYEKELWNIERESLMTIKKTLDTPPPAKETKIPSQRLPTPGGSKKVPLKIPIKSSSHVVQTVPVKHP